MKKIIYVLLMIAFSMTGNVHSYAAEFDISAGVGMLRGNTTYRIGYPVDYVYFGEFDGHFPFSELEFPLDLTMFSIDCSVTFAKQFELGLDFQTNISDDPGDMKDSDWITSSDPNRLDIFSTSDAELDAMIWDVGFGYKFYKTRNWTFTGGLGYLYQNYDFNTRLKRQYSPSGLSGYDAVGDGSASLTYEVTYRIPYMDISTQYAHKNKFILDTSFGFSPFVSVTDMDRHLLRNKVNKGNLDGNAILLSLAGRYYLYHNWFVSIGMDYTKIVTEKGNMKARFTGAESIYNHTVTEEIESDQISILFKVGYGS